MGTCGLGRGLRLAQLRRGDHLLGLGDLLGRFDRDDPPFEFLEASHNSNVPSKGQTARKTKETDADHAFEPAHRPALPDVAANSEERRGGKGVVSRGRSRWWPAH